MTLFYVIPIKKKYFYDKTKLTHCRLNDTETSGQFRTFPLNWDVHIFGMYRSIHKKLYNTRLFSKIVYDEITTKVSLDSI